MFPQNVTLSFQADTIHMSKTIPDGSAHGSDIREAEKKGSTINYGESCMHSMAIVQAACKAEYGGPNHFSAALS